MIARNFSLLLDFTIASEILWKRSKTYTQQRRWQETKGHTIQITEALPNCSETLLSGRLLFMPKRTHWHQRALPDGHNEHCCAHPANSWSFAWRLPLWHLSTAAQSESSSPDSNQIKMDWGKGLVRVAILIIMVCLIGTLPSSSSPLRAALSICSLYSCSA